MRRVVFFFFLQEGPLFWSWERISCGKIIGQNGGPRGSSRRRELPHGHGKEQVHTGCKSQQENHTPGSKVRVELFWHICNGMYLVLLWRYSAPPVILQQYFSLIYSFLPSYFALFKTFFMVINFGKIINLKSSISIFDVLYKIYSS